MTKESQPTAPSKAHRTRLDRTFTKFAKQVDAMRPEGGTAIFRGISINVSFDPGLQGLFKATVNGKAYDLRDSLQSKAALAADGLLGHDLRALGIRCQQAVNERLHREKVRKAFDKVKALYGNQARKVWNFKDKERALLRSPKIAEAALAVLQYLNTQGTLPASIAACRKAGITFRFLTTQEWKLVQRLTAYLSKEDTKNAQ